MDISGQIAVITGAASGMGAATAKALAKSGAKIAAIDLNLEDAQKTAAETGGRAFGCDVSDAAAVEAVFKDITSEMGVPRIVVNCAGICPASRVVGREAPHDLALFEKVLSVNLVGSFNVLRLAAAEMSKADPVNDDGENGVIINTASVAAFDGQIGQAGYSASKAGVVGMTLPIARELARFGIRVVTVAPGLIETPMLAGMPQEVHDSLVATTIFPKRLGKADEFAALVKHICENALINGETIRLDGAVRLAPK
ncbi:MAG: SDR family NAD(P)-dependent oxidoreductase [Pseudomonadota bacterium]|nr:SDR family NAD(P)-dependent oxidoreductase [Pseudomonadota bacterium]QKK04416.1 MAG: SDR family NAD(P)-dependent oxidoreductase [Pseudomonadota bacterium]